MLDPRAILATVVLNIMFLSRKREEDVPGLL